MENWDVHGAKITTTTCPEQRGEDGNWSLCVAPSPANTSVQLAARPPALAGATLQMFKEERKSRM